MTAPTRAARRLRRARGGLAAGLVAAILLLLGAGPAAAHSGMTKDWQYYRSVVTAVSPQVPGLTLTLLTDGEQVTLTNDTGKVVEVLGYNGEDYLRIGPDGVEENTASLSAYLNGTLVATGVPQQQPAPGAPPAWKRVADGTTFAWHDHRTHWMSVSAPPVVAADPRKPHVVFDWTLQLRVGGTPVDVDGRLSWVGKPRFAGLVLPLVAVGVTVVLVAGALVAVRVRAGGARAGSVRADSVRADSAAG